MHFFGTRPCGAAECSSLLYIVHKSYQGVSGHHLRFPKAGNSFPMLLGCSKVPWDFTTKPKYEAFDRGPEAPLSFRVPDLEKFDPAREQ